MLAHWAIHVWHMRQKPPRAHRGCHCQSITIWVLPEVEIAGHARERAKKNTVKLSLLLIRARVHGALGICCMYMLVTLHALQSHAHIFAHAQVKFPDMQCSLVNYTWADHACFASGC